eukprot:COSAG06_NODE_3199_length_5697_cov_6.906752_9_plen_63_part_00
MFSCSAILKPDSILAVEGMAPLFQAPCDLHACRDTNTKGGGVLAQLELAFQVKQRIFCAILH